MPKTTRKVKIDYTSWSEYHDGPQDPNTIVYHDWEAEVVGSKDLQWLKDILDAKKLSVHHAITSDGRIGQYLHHNQIGRGGRPNTGKIHIELEGYAAYPKWFWLSPAHHWQLVKLARLTAQLSRDHNIPLVRSTTHGVCTHGDLKLDGHTDPGPGFPFYYVLRMAITLRKTVFR